MSTRWMPALATLAFALAACGNAGASDEPTASPTTAPAAAASTAPADAVAPSEPENAAAEPVGDDVAVPASLQFTAPLVGGGELNAAELADKPTVFWFWAPD